MKTVNLYCLLISVLCLIFIWGCGQGTELENSNDSLEVEINLAKYLSVNKQDLKLIGFKTFYVSDENERIKKSQGRYGNLSESGKPDGRYGNHDRNGL